MKATIFITLGHGADLGIDPDGKLFISDHNQQITLGPATHKALTDLQSYIERLKCFTFPLSTKA